MVEAGADVTILCANGYIALEQAIFSGTAGLISTYTDFKQFGRLPRPRDGLVRTFQLEKPGEENELGVLIFSSYRWLN
ncbi:hypothetical protein MYCTH_2129201 [Thermothelomyces thermophilus ATCC 42464]|uniref:Uncharacterized protein n=1 Tax=Thermothelomyces thermophilus (strain ATCC 42464 / BCRC 31852 / DSM 1799) TaxID=573729 RepID=G2QKK3_THET4|nr:uncharacterized protein MYCTH_2129201 [Thermothelomyces thermophilus ATCC 42464]AEO60109.1 hypothetical protein MYCTH_2129201 [Thermothelomyces thermophilus ATCC 42464]